MTGAGRGIGTGIAPACARETVPVSVRGDAEAVHLASSTNSRRAGADHRSEWEQRGVIGPLEVLTRHEAARIARDFREQYARSGIVATRNRHPDLPVLAELCAHPNLWWPAHDLLGDKLLLWRTNMFLGNPRLPWHEDRHARLFVGGAFNLSMLLAFEDSRPDNCTVVVPGSHVLTAPEKEARYGVTATYKALGNVRYAGEIAAGFREPLPLKAGEMALFHPRLLHASSGFVNGGEQAAEERMSIAFRVTTSGVEVRDEAFPEEHEDRERVLRTIRCRRGSYTIT